VFEHVLLATDFSDASERALAAAADLTGALRARLTVLHVYPLHTTTTGVAERTWPGGIRARARLDRVVAGLRARGLRVDGALRFGFPPEQIVQGALETGADLIVTGTRRRRGFARMWHGSVSHEVARDSPIPVLALPVPSGTPGAALRRCAGGHADAPRENVIYLRPR
jgi:nucleotide-binding universal stress UspA family protein